MYGSPFKSYAVPLKNSMNEIVGCVMVARNLDRSKNLLSISQKMTESFQQVTAAVTELSTDIQNIAAMNKGIADKSDDAMEYSHATNDILEFISGASSQTNLIGLNASIEAARIGNVGRGFQVIAHEIRRMSVNTTDSIKKIDGILVNIEGAIKTIASNIKESNSVFHDQIATLEEITESMNELSAVSKSIELLAEQI